MIVKNVFGFEQIVGGSLGSIIIIGVQCGLFLNEVGMGSVLNVAVIVYVLYLVKQGFIQMFGVFFDIFIVCILIVFIILLYSVMFKGDGI